MTERRGFLAGLLGLFGVRQAAGSLTICTHRTRRGGSVYLVLTTSGAGPDESEYGKSWLGADWCADCGALFLPDEWRKRKA